jgi:hypothetical protein
MNKHKCRVKEMMENNDELSRDLFLNEQDICKLVGKLAKKRIISMRMMPR